MTCVRVAGDEPWPYVADVGEPQLQAARCAPPPSAEYVQHGIRNIPAGNLAGRVATSEGGIADSSGAPGIGLKAIGLARRPMPRSRSPPPVRNAMIPDSHGICSHGPSETDMPPAAVEGCISCGYGIHACVYIYI